MNLTSPASKSYTFDLETGYVGVALSFQALGDFLTNSPSLTLAYNTGTSSGSTTYPGSQFTSYNSFWCNHNRAANLTQQVSLSSGQNFLNITFTASSISSEYLLQYVNMFSVTTISNQYRTLPVLDLTTSFTGWIQNSGVPASSALTNAGEVLRIQGKDRGAKTFAFKSTTGYVNISCEIWLDYVTSSGTIYLYVNDKYESSCTRSNFLLSGNSYKCDLFKKTTVNIGDVVMTIRIENPGTIISLFDMKNFAIKELSYAEYDPSASPSSSLSSRSSSNDGTVNLAPIIIPVVIFFFVFFGVMITVCAKRAAYRRTQTMMHNAQMKYDNPTNVSYGGMGNDPYMNNSTMNYSGMPMNQNNMYPAYDQNYNSMGQQPIYTIPMYQASVQPVVMQPTVIQVEPNMVQPQQMQMMDPYYQPQYINMQPQYGQPNFVA